MLDSFLTNNTFTIHHHIAQAIVISFTQTTPLVFFCAVFHFWISFCIPPTDPSGKMNKHGTLNILFHMYCPNRDRVSEKKTILSICVSIWIPESEISLILNLLIVYSICICTQSCLKQTIFRQHSKPHGEHFQ